jgi:truncated hemoglobin YjbI
MLVEIGGEEGCRQLSAAFYARVGGDATLKPLFPGKSLRCATEEFAAFLIQFLGGDEEQTQHRWWLSLRESHARFQITPAQRSAWLKHMSATLQASPIGEPARAELQSFFLHTSSYVAGNEPQPAQMSDELTARWSEQLSLDDLVHAIAAGETKRVLAEAPRFAARPSVFAGLLTRMLQSGDTELCDYVVQSVQKDPSFGARRFGGRPFFHLAAAAGAVTVVRAILDRSGLDPNLQDRGGHTALYCVANECASAEAGPELVKILVRAGADVNAAGGVTKATPLHMAARRGHLAIAQALLANGASLHAVDSKGVTPLQRARNLRRADVVEMLLAEAAGANVTSQNETE